MSKDRWYLIIPLILCVLVMIPRLVSPQFGLFDDVNTLATVQDVTSGNWDLNEESASGRFRPVYWYFYSTIYLLAGANPFWFMLGNLVLLIGVTVELMAIIKMYALSNLQASLAGSAFVLSGPIIENAYTLSKGELQQSFWLLGALLLCIHIARSQHTNLPRAAGVGLVAMLVFFGIATKETSLVILPISFSWFLVGIIRRRMDWPDLPNGFRKRADFAIASAAGSVLYLGLRYGYLTSGLTAQGYSSNYVLSGERMLSSARIWMDWLNRDFLYLFPLLFIGLFMFIRGESSRDRILILDAAAWMVGWLALFIPWIHQQEYYLLPFSVGASLVAGTIIGRVLQKPKRLRQHRLVEAALAGLSIPLFLLTLPNNYTQAKLQLLTDRTNDEMVAYLRESLPPGSALYVNLSKSSQYLWDLERYLNEYYERDDIRIEGYTFQDPGRDEIRSDAYFILIARLSNQYYPSIRMGVYEHTTREWNSAMLDHLGFEPNSIFEIHRIMRLVIIDAARLFCPAFPKLAYCQAPNTPLDLRELSYGWELFQIPVEP